MAVQNYPLDFDALAKGDVISVEQLTKILGLKPDHPHFMLKVLSLKERIENELMDRGNPVTARIHHNAIHICTDLEASEYNAGMSEQGFRKMVRSHRRNLVVDTQLFKPEEKQSHERRLLVSGAMLAACITVRKSPQLAVAIRKTPGLLESDGEKESNGEAPDT